MRKRIALVLLVALVPVRFDAGESPAFSPERIKADVTRLAADRWEGRRAGTRGADRAAEWLAGEFRRIGLAPAGVAGSYFQRFTFVGGVLLGPGNRLTIAGASRAWTAGRDFRPLAFSAPGTAEGEVVFCGYGVTAAGLGYDDYEGVDVKDRIALVLRYGPDGDDPHSKWYAYTPLRYKATRAREKGARAVLVVTGPRTPEAKDALVPLGSDLSQTDGGIPAFSITRQVAAALLAGAGTTLDAAQARIDDARRPAPFLVPGVRVALTADVRPQRAAARNVVGVVQALSEGREAVVLGAHYDHLGLGMTGSLEPVPNGKIHHGADDNASGVAGLLELARHLATRPRTLGRSVVFVAFGAEEEGTLGSSMFVKHPPLPLDRIVAMVNMDMIGRLRDDALVVEGVGTSPIWPTLVGPAGEGAGLKLRFHESGYGASDHTPFYAAGRPVLSFFTGSHGDYHRSSDTADKIDASGIVRVLSVVEPVVSGLASNETAVAFTRVAADKETGATGARSFGVWVGGVPDYSAEEVGVRFTGVSPGSPAEIAGILAGDVLVRFGPREIRNIYDYTYSLGEYRAGDKVEAVVKRGGREVRLEITLGVRPGTTR